MRAVIACCVVFVLPLAGCLGGEDATQASNSEDQRSGASEQPVTSPAEAPEEPATNVTRVREAYQEERGSVQIGHPRPCLQSDDIAGPRGASDVSGQNGIDWYAWELAPDSSGLDYDFTAGATGQDMMGYEFWFLGANRQHLSESSGAALVAGQVHVAKIPDGAAYGVFASCAGGNGEGFFTSYRWVEMER